MDDHGSEWERLDRYVSGRGTPDELEALRRWVESDPELRALAETMRTAGRCPETPPAAWNTRGNWQQLQRRMRWADRPPLRLTGSGDVSAPGWRRAGGWRAVAAAAAVVLTAGTSLWIVSGQPALFRETVVATAAPMREVAARRGQRISLDLPDGSRVVVAAESRLRIPVTYRAAAGVRDVYLEGEAYFEVDHDEARPFRVHAANGVAEDLGTEFVVTAYPETRGMQVVVASGAVALRTADTLRAQPRALLTLTRGDLGRLDAAGAATLTRDVKLESYLAWVEGNLVFDGAPLRDVIPSLARWYDLDIRLTNAALGNRRLTATIRHQPAAQVIELLALSLDLRVQRNGQSVVLSPQSRPRRSP